MTAALSGAENESERRRKNMTRDNCVMLLIATSLASFGGGSFLTAQRLGGSEDKMLYYRSVLIKHGVAEYRADENGEPMFVIKAEPIKP